MASDRHTTTATEADRLRTLGDQLARIAARIAFMGMNRVAEDLLAVARELRQIAFVPVSAPQPEEAQPDDR